MVRWCVCVRWLLCVVEPAACGAWGGMVVVAGVSVVAVAVVAGVCVLG